MPEETASIDTGEYAAQLRKRIQSAYETVNVHLRTKTQRMKTRYDAKVRSFQLKPGDYVLYYCPRRKPGRYQKWRRLCTISRVEARFNDVLYSIRTSPRAKPIVAHIDRLRQYLGDIPEMWKSVPKLPREEVETTQAEYGENSATYGNGKDGPQTISSGAEKSKTVADTFNSEVTSEEHHRSPVSPVEHRPTPVGHRQSPDECRPIPVSPVEHHTVGEAAVSVKAPDKPDRRSPEVVANIAASEGTALVEHEGRSQRRRQPPA